MQPESHRIPSPCVRNCCLDDEDICLGCFRSLEEICLWGSLSANDKMTTMELAAKRREEFGLGKTNAIIR